MHILVLNIESTIFFTFFCYKNHWVPRKGETGPKKIDEVHKDFEQEQATKQFLNNQPPPPRNDNPQQNRRNSKRKFFNHRSKR